MTEQELADAVEVVPERLYWVALQSHPKNTLKTHYFSIDRDLVYEPFSADFGPLNLSCVCKYCKILEVKLTDPNLRDKRIIHYCSHDYKKRCNAALLFCSYQVAAMGRSPEAAWEPFRAVSPAFPAYRDATSGHCSYQCTILDCLRGLAKSIECRWFDWRRFNITAYDYFEKVENGDMSWIIPGKFLAFAGPCPTTTDADGYPAFTPEDCVPIFKEAGIRLVVRLNKKQYDRRRFIDYGIKHVDLYFMDGSCPSREIITKFLHITENEPGAVAVHCKAGLGRTGTLIGFYAMKHFRFPARAFIGWNRLCRPGSILGPQQQFLVDMEMEMFQVGKPRSLAPPWVPDSADPSLWHQVSGLQANERGVPERHQGEQYEDVGQGDRLVSAKRGVREVRGGVQLPNGDLHSGGASGPASTGSHMPRHQNGVVSSPVHTHHLGIGHGGPDLPFSDPSASADLMKQLPGKPQGQDSRPVVSMLKRGLGGVFRL